MAKTSSNQFSKGALAPDFTLINTLDDQPVTLSKHKGQKGTVVMFICNHCPFVLHINRALVRLANDYKDKGFSFLGISSNAVVNYPQDGPDKMKTHALDLAYPFPYLYDETQQVAKAYDAACTPDFFVFDASLACLYNGQLDDARPGNQIPVSGCDIREVLEALKNNTSVSSHFKPSVGCGIKWK